VTLDRPPHQIAELLEPHKQTLINHVFKRRLPQIAPPAQIGYVHAMTYCLSLRPPLAIPSTELLQFLNDALNVVDDDRIIPDTRAQAAIVSLRTVSVELLRAAMSSRELRLADNQSELRNRIILLFFKVLTKGYKEGVEAAKAGLSQVLQAQNRKTAVIKDLLQNSLRPLLVNLADIKKLNLSLLEGLARLLELLSNWFNASLGEKLLEYLKKWTEGGDKSEAAKAPRSADEAKLPAAIIELFHLLPPSPNGKFLDRLVMYTMTLEQMLNQIGSYSALRSPYRIPLAKFLNKFAADAMEFFLPRLSNAAVARLFDSILRLDIAGPLREELGKCVDRFLISTLRMDPSVESHTEGRFQGVRIVRTMQRHNADWLGENPTVLAQLLAMWGQLDRARLSALEEAGQVEHLTEPKLLAKVLMKHVLQRKDDLNALFALLNVFSHRTLMDFSFLRDFFLRRVAVDYSTHQKREIIRRFLHLFRDASVGADVKVSALQLLVVPMLNATFQTPDTRDLIDAPFAAQIVRDIFDCSEETIASYDENLRSELLQLSTVLIRYANDVMTAHRYPPLRLLLTPQKGADQVCVGPLEAGGFLFQAMGVR
jgi:transformation/transcription domain-associated protein